METSTFVYELKVGMTCGGCSGAVERILGKESSKQNRRFFYVELF